MHVIQMNSINNRGPFMKEIIVSILIIIVAIITENKINCSKEQLYMCKTYHFYIMYM